MAVRAWTDFDVEYAWTILPANVEDYLMNKLRRGSKAQQSLLETANSLEDAGYGASMLRGNAGSFKAQHSLLETAASLEDAGFTQGQVGTLLKGNNASAKVQKVILTSIKKLTSWDIPKRTSQQF